MDKCDQLRLLHKRKNGALNGGDFRLQIEVGSLLVSEIEAVLEQSEEHSSESEGGLNDSRGEFLLFYHHVLDLEL